MMPNTPIRGFLIGWCIAALLGGGPVLWHLRRAGLRPAPAVVWCVVIVAALFVGAKLFYLIDVWPALLSQRIAWRAALVSPQLRLPGGFALAVLAAFPLARWLRMPYWRSMDQVVPAAGLLIVGGRIGCFLEGCCFGTPSSLPWAVRFPASWPPTEVFGFQLMYGVIPLGASATLPVHPLQLYYAVVGLLLCVGLTAYRSGVRYDGELLLLFMLVYLWSTWLLGHLRAAPGGVAGQLVLVAAVALTGLAGVIETRTGMSRGVRENPDFHVTTGAQG